MFIRPQPTPAVIHDERAVPVAMPVYKQEYESYYFTLYHPTPPAVLDNERAARFSPFLYLYRIIKGFDLPYPIPPLPRSD